MKLVVWIMQVKAHVTFSYFHLSSSTENYIKQYSCPGAAGIKSPLSFKQLQKTSLWHPNRLYAVNKSLSGLVWAFVELRTTAPLQS